MITKQIVADGPVSRILWGPLLVTAAGAAIIPLGHGSRRNSSSLPEGSLSVMACAIAEGARLHAPVTDLAAERPRNVDSSSRAGSPLLFGLAPRGVFPASDVAIGAVGSYPTFSPLPNDASDWKTSGRFSCAMSPRCAAGGMFSVALSVSDSRGASLSLHRWSAPLALPGALPFTLGLREAGWGFPRWC
jgi:hypothetical protein